MSDSELQEEEKEVLLSIYEGDPAFKMISDNTYQYKVSTQCFHTFLVLYRYIL